MLLVATIPMLLDSLQLWQYAIQLYLWKGKYNLLNIYELYLFEGAYVYTLLLMFMPHLLIICSKSGAISYKAQSQDEDALVQAAAHLHMVLISKNGNTIGMI